MLKLHSCDKCMIKIFMGKGGGWGGGRLAVKDGSFQKHLKIGVGKGKSCLYWEEVLKVSPLLPKTRKI